MAKIKFIDRQKRYPEYGDAYGRYIGDYRFSRYGIGSVYALDTPYGVRLDAYFREGDPASDWERTRNGWADYAYTHGGSTYRARCQILHDLAVEIGLYD